MQHSLEEPVSPFTITREPHIHECNSPSPLSIDDEIAMNQNLGLKLTLFNMFRTRGLGLGIAQIAVGVSEKKVEKVHSKLVSATNNISI